jgi:hypothetical protein
MSDRLLDARCGPETPVAASPPGLARRASPAILKFILNII